jgi:hypothetical protein
MCCLGRQTLVTSTKVTVAAPQADVKAAMMAKLEAEAANLKKVLARQQAEKQAIAQSQQPSEHHSNQPGDKTSTAQVDSTPAVARDSKSTNPLKQYPQDTLSVRPADTPAADTHSGGATVVDSGSPSVEDTVPIPPVPAQIDSTPVVTGDSKSTEPLKQQPKDDIVPESPVESPEEQTLPGDTSAPVEQTIPGDTSAKSIEPQTLSAKNGQSTKDDDDEIETIWKFYDEHQMIFNVPSTEPQSHAYHIATEPCLPHSHRATLALLFDWPQSVRLLE